MRIPVLVAAALAALVPATAFADPALERGRDLAVRWCTGCHVIGFGTPGGDAGPAFPSVARREGQSIDDVRAWLADPHPPMPDLDLSAAQFDDLAAYIMSLGAD